MQFNYRIRKNPETVLEQVVRLAEDKLVVSGNSRRGTFTGAFDGSYEVQGSEASIMVRRKPMFVSWSLVDKGLRYLIA